MALPLLYRPLSCVLSSGTTSTTVVMRNRRPLGSDAPRSVKLPLSPEAASLATSKASPASSGSPKRMLSRSVAFMMNGA